MARTVVHFTGGLVFGGLEQVLLTILRGLNPERWHSVLYHYADADIEPLLEGARAVGVETRAVERMPEQPFPGRAIRLARLLCAEQPAIFHAHLSVPEYCKVALIAAALSRIPGIIATQQLFQSRPSRRLLLYQRILSTRVNRYIAVSHNMKRRLLCELRIPERKITVIHNGVPVGPSHPPLYSRDFAGNDERPPIVFTSARLDVQKGLTHLLEAASFVPKARFIIAGDGPQRAELENRARSMGLGNRVQFLGHRRDVPELLADCDIYVLPSLFEGLPLSILEAMAAARPVIATAVGGVGEAVINGKTGLLVPPGNPELLADAIRRLIANPNLAAQLAIAARARVVQEFSADSMLRGITRTYDELSCPSSTSAH